MRPLALFCAAAMGLCSAGAMAQQDNSHLAAAEKLISELKFALAQGELQQAWQEDGNSRATALRILELQGVVAGNLRQGKKADGFFRRLLTLDPNRELAGDYSPRVTTPFFEAKSWVADHGALQFVAQKPEASDGSIHSVRAQVRSDPFELGQSVRFHVRPKGGPWNTFEQPLTQGQARALIEAKAVEWWAELLGEHGAQLLLIGAEGTPLIESVSPVVAEAPPPPSLTPAPPPPSVTPAPLAAGSVHAENSEGPAYRPLAYTLVAAGVVAGGAGIYLGYRSQNDLSQISNATRDPSGNITGITQVKAMQLDADSRNVAPWANALMAAGGGLLVGGALVWWLGRDTVTTVALGPSGVSFAGTFP